MERWALCYRAIPEKKQEYIKAHREIWPEITKGLTEAGCHELTIFMRGNNLFIYALIDDVAEFNRIRDRDPFYHKWDDWMKTLLESPFDAEEPGPFAEMEEIWRFDEGTISFGKLK
ncbi:MAG TPA: L-rhamnose mutarotase [Spirochaetia bacterium]|nr:L-rhamnose mutarotase [Spirochaetia bacterium]